MTDHSSNIYLSAVKNITYTTRYIFKEQNHQEKISNFVKWQYFIKLCWEQQIKQILHFSRFFIYFVYLRKCYFISLELASVVLKLCVATYHLRWCFGKSRNDRSVNQKYILFKGYKKYNALNKTRSCARVLVEIC